MSHHVIIDGNNLLYAMHEHAPLPHVGRETLVKIIERWALKCNDQVTLVFDGSAPPAGLAQQMSSPRITVRFSAPVTADDVIVEMIEQAKQPHQLRIVTSDGAIRKEASYRKCQRCDSASFVAELFPATAKKDVPPTAPPPEKPSAPSADETQDWLKQFGFDEKEESDDD